MLYPIITSTRAIHSLDGIWDFRLDRHDGHHQKGFVPEKSVAVPGSYNDLYVEEEIRTHGNGVWYGKRFHMPGVLRGERLVLRFGSVNYHATVYLNHVRLGDHETGYTPFEFDVTDLIQFDQENLLTVHVSTELSASTIPMGNLGNSSEPGQISGQFPDTPFDFLSYAGIHRPVLIYTTGREAWLDDVRIVTTDLSGDKADILIKGSCKGACSRVLIRVEGTFVHEECTPEENTFETTLSILDPRVWDTATPHLYHLCIDLVDEKGDVLDQYRQPFGVRTVKVGDGHLLLNGRPVYLQGFGRHEDFHIIGRGLNHSVNIRDHELLRWINANSYRTSHYPYSEELVQLADQQGFLLIAEVPAVSINMDYVTPRTLELHKQTIRELIARDFNSPSVIMWSVANEPNSDREKAHSYFGEIAALTRSLDQSRPVTIVTCKPVDDVSLEHFDIVSLNTYPGWYWLPGSVEKACEDLKQTLDSLYQKVRKPIFVAEFGADSIPGLHSLPAEQWSEDYQVDLIIALLKVIRSCDYVIGEHIWNFADFRTAQNFTRPGGNRKGVFTRERQPKMVARFVREFWATHRKFDGLKS